MLTSSLPVRSKSTLRRDFARSWHFKPSHTATPLKRPLSISLRGPCIRSSRLARELPGPPLEIRTPFLYYQLRVVPISYACCAS